MQQNETELVNEIEALRNQRDGFLLKDRKTKQSLKHKRQVAATNAALITKVNQLRHLRGLRPLPTK